MQRVRNPERLGVRVPRSRVPCTLQGALGVWQGVSGGLNKYGAANVIQIWPELAWRIDLGWLTASEGL